MKIFKLFIVIPVLFFACSHDQIVKNTNSGKVEIVNQNVPVVGWIDNDTYTVKVSAPDLDSAIDMARHKILQDIVKVRMMNESRYTDITKISAEFDKPMKEGKVINKIEGKGVIEVYYQIRDEGLRTKFERK